FHRRGTPQAEDKLIYERPDEPKWGFGAFVTEDERFLCLSVWQGAGGKNGFFYRDLKTDREEFVEWNADFESRWNFLGNDGTVFYFETDQAAPNGRIVSCDVSGQEPPVLNEILSEGDHALDSVSLIGDRLIVSRMVDVLNEVTIYDLEGREERKVELPGVGSIWGFGGEREADEVFYYFSSYTVPGSVYRYDLEAGTSALFAKPETAFEAEKYETKQFFYPSKDGTLVPLFVTVAKDREGPVPLYLYGYGGFNVSLTPYYSTSIATWLDMGGAYVVANLRGGGEFGEAWHEAGMKDQKQNVFDDFQAAATFLVSEGWTTHEQLAIGGGSNGGLLVGACVNQRPGLYRAAVAQVGVYDMLRFPEFTIGWAWTDDYGDPKVKEEFEALYAYSPYHQAREQDYPALLLTTADHDDRV
ncbi:MAG: prolyl oligopeptidase family serine peptidase, partial [Verrucomicrobiota bacterium]